MSVPSSGATFGQISPLTTTLRNVLRDYSGAQIINELILSPEGAPLQGNIHLHCGGGMHRSGMIMDDVTE